MGFVSAGIEQLWSIQFPIGVSSFAPFFLQGKGGSDGHCLAIEARDFPPILDGFVEGRDVQLQAAEFPGPKAEQFSVQPREAVIVGPHKAEPGAR